MLARFDVGDEGPKPMKGCHRDAGLVHATMAVQVCHARALEKPEVLSLGRILRPAFEVMRLGPEVKPCYTYAIIKSGHQILPHPSCAKKLRAVFIPPGVMLLEAEGLSSAPL